MLSQDTEKELWNLMKNEYGDVGENPNVKKFISNLLAKQNERKVLKGERRRVIEQIKSKTIKEVVEKIENMRKIERWTENCCLMVDEKAISYNQALEDLLTNLKD